MERNPRKEREGVVVSAKMQKTAVVRVQRTEAHPQYHKVVSRSKKYYADTTRMNVKEGQTVRIVETRPISKLKRWRVVEVVQ